MRLPTKEGVGKWLPAEVPNCLVNNGEVPESLIAENLDQNFEGLNLERQVRCCRPLHQLSAFTERCSSDKRVGASPTTM